MSERCHTCRHWQKSNFNEGSGACRRHAPAPAPEAQTGIDAYSETDDRGFWVHYNKLKSIAKNPTLWPTGSEQPSGAAVAQGRVLLKELQVIDLLPDKVVASAEGGIAICFANGEKYSDLECLNSGQILGVTSNRRDRPVVWEVDQSPSGFVQAVARVREFIGSPQSNDQKRKAGR